MNGGRHCPQPEMQTLPGAEGESESGLEKMCVPVVDL